VGRLSTNAGTGNLKMLFPRSYWKQPRQKWAFGKQELRGEVGLTDRVAKGKHKAKI